MLTRTFHQEMLVAGGGIGGLAAALACHRAGWRARVFEQAQAFGDEAGAGLQLGPNATRVLHGWGLEAALARVAAFPAALQIRSAGSGHGLARLALGNGIRTRYGAPYATLHRADLHGLLLEAVRGSAETALHAGSRIETLAEEEAAVCATLRATGEGGRAAAQVEADAAVVADGIWSRLRTQCLPADPPPRTTGHVAYRALLRQSALPASLRSDQVTVWLAERLHVVAYPVRAGDWLNLVVLAEPGRSALPDPQDWNAPAPGSEVAGVLAGGCSALQALREAVPEWRRWTLADRAPLRSADAMATGRIALLGDAAHPMLPYLAQGAGMAIEDAAELQRMLSMDGVDVALRLWRYALNRWRRVARVQATARRNARVFHAAGPLRWGRDLALRTLGPRLLDQPWLYG